jgi:O-succinylbenzoate synthase
VQTLVDFDNAIAFAIPLKHGGTREGMLLEGPQGWGEFSPEDRYTADVAARWLTAATEPGTVGWPDPVRGRIPVSITIPTIDAADARRIAAECGCRAADVDVAASADSMAADIARLEAVRDALGSEGAIRIRCRSTANRALIAQLDRAAGGLEYIEYPCAMLDDLAALRTQTAIPIAAPAPMFAAADIAVLTVGPLGGARRALRIAEKSGLPCVVSSSVETTIGLAAGLALAGALPDLNFACSLGTMPLLAGDVVAEARSLVPRDGYLPVAPMPPAPDLDRVHEFGLTGERANWWRTRLERARDFSN